jgi:ATP-dependent protease HslVU (ClpYQ) ATPase subunit
MLIIVYKLYRLRIPIRTAHDLRTVTYDDKSKLIQRYAEKNKKHHNRHGYQHDILPLMHDIVVPRTKYFILFHFIPFHIIYKKIYILCW